MERREPMEEIIGHYSNDRILMCEISVNRHKQNRCPAYKPAHIYYEHLVVLNLLLHRSLLTFAGNLHINYTKNKSNNGILLL